MTAPATLIRTGFPGLLPQDRVPGRHLSDVTRSMCAALGDYDHVDLDASPPTQLMQLGLTMEHGLAHQLAHHYPGRYLRAWDARFDCWKYGLQVERDGIVGNLDLLNVGEEPGVMIVEDPKMTRKSSRHSHDEVTGGGQVVWSPKWRESWMRVAGYCWMVGARVGRLWVAHLFDYSARFGGDVWCGVWERRWDNAEGEKELSENWRAILTHERGMPPCSMH